MTFQEIAKKRVFNIPILYWALAGVIVLAIVAWRMKPAVGPATEGTSTDPATGDGLVDPTTDDYDGLLPSGTVVVQPQPQTPATPEEKTNEKWAVAAADYLRSSEGGNLSPIEAQTAISLYLQGNELSIQQKAAVDKAIGKVGFPPEPLGTLGTVAKSEEAPPQKQFSGFPGKHTVKGLSDNTAAKLATLYYGSAKTALGVPKIGQYNEHLGPASSVTYRIGDVIFIPGYEEPRYFTVTATKRYPKDIAATMPAGTRTPSDIEALNPNQSWPAAVGAKVRIV